MGFVDWAVKKLWDDSSISSTGLESATYLGELADNGGRASFDSEKPLSQKTTPEIRRIPLAELEACYLSEPTTFNSVNKTVQLIMAPGYHLEGDKKSVAFFEDFFNHVGSIGGEMEWDEMLNCIFKHELVFGDAWIELLKAKRDKDKWVDLQLIDSKKMDYAKNENNKIILDGHGDPIGYVETLPWGYDAPVKIESPKNAVVNDNQIFLPRKKVAHFKLYTIGDGFYPSGMVEPSYNSIRYKIHLENAHANSVKKNGFARIIISHGDERHEPTQEQIVKSLGKVRDMENLGIFAVPYHVKLSLLEPKNVSVLKEYLNYYIDQIVTGFGLPRALATGEGGDTARSTLNRQEALTKLTLNDIVRRTVRVLEKEVIKLVAESNGVNPVKIIWGRLSLEELDTKAKRLSSYAKVSLLTPDKNIEKAIRDIEDLPEEIGESNVKPKPGNGESSQVSEDK